MKHWFWIAYLKVENLQREKAQLRGGNIELNNAVYRFEQKLKDREIHLNKLQEMYNHLLARQQKECIPPPNSGFYSDRNDLPFRFDSFLDQNDRRLSISSVHSNGSASSRPKVVPDGSGSVYLCADEEEFPFNESNFEIQSFGGHQVREQENELSSGGSLARLSELQRRNTLVPPHLRSVYPSEYVSLNNEVKLSEENIRVTEESYFILIFLFFKPNMFEWIGPFSSEGITKVGQWTCWEVEITPYHYQSTTTCKPHFYKVKFLKIKLGVSFSLNFCEFQGPGTPKKPGISTRRPFSETSPHVNKSRHPMNNQRTKSDSVSINICSDAFQSPPSSPNTAYNHTEGCSVVWSPPGSPPCSESNDSFLYLLVLCADRFLRPKQRSRRLRGSDHIFKKGHMRFTLKNLSSRWLRNCLI